MSDAIELTVASEPTLSLEVGSDGVSPSQFANLERWLRDQWSAVEAEADVAIDGAESVDATVTKVDDTATITVTDRNGIVHTATVTDGKDATITEGSIDWDKFAPDVTNPLDRLMYRLSNMLTATPAEATVTTVADAAQTPMAGLTLYGNSTQDGTPTPDAPVPIESVAGNLFEVTASTQTINGVTFAPQDGVVKVTGTATGSAFYVAGTVTLPAGTYILAVYADGMLVTATSHYRIYVNGSGVTANSGAPFTAAQAVTLTVYVQAISGQTFNDETVCLALYRGSTAYPYVPYGCIGLHAAGRNLVSDLQINMAENPNTSAGVSFQRNSDGSLRIYGTATGNSMFDGNYRRGFITAPIKRAGTYTVSLSPTGSVGGLTTYVLYRRRTITNQESPVANMTGQASLTFTLTEAQLANGDLFSIGFSVANGTTIDVTVYPQLEVGSTATAYQPYTSTVTPIPLDGHELRSLPDGTRDEVTVDEYGHAVLIQRVGHVVLDGSSDESWHAYSAAGKFRMGTTAIAALVAKPASNSVLVPMVCTQFEPKTAAYAITPNEGIGVPTSGNLTCYHESFQTASAWTAHLAENPMTVTYPLATPVTHDLGTIDPIPLVGPDLTAQPIPDTTMALTYERDLNVTPARPEAAIASMWGNRLTGSMSGTVLTTDDAYAAPPLEVEVDGKSEQVTTTGKNLFDKSAVTPNRYINSSGGLSNWNAASASGYTPVEPNTSYTISFANECGNQGLAFYTDANVESFISFKSLSSTTLLTFTTPENAAYLRFSCYTTVLDSAQLESGSTATAYEPYTGGKPSPSPDYPQDILSVDELTYYAAGKNLLNVANPTASIIATYTYENDTLTVTATTANGWCYVEHRVLAVEWMQGQSVTLSTIASATSTPLFGIDFYRADDTRISYAVSSTQAITRTVPYETSYIKVHFYARNQQAGAVGDTATYRNIQLELGSTATAYEPYQATTVTLPVTLRSLPDGTRDTATYTYLRPSSREGWAWYGGSITRNVYSRLVYSTDWRITSAPMTYGTQWYAKLSPLAAYGRPYDNVYCSDYARSSIATTEQPVNTIRTSNDGTMAYGVAASGATPNECELLYKLATPTTETLDPIELPVLPAPNVTIWATADATPTLQVTYEKDVNITIAALEAAIADLATS